MMKERHLSMVTMYVIDNAHVNVNSSDAISIVDRRVCIGRCDGSLVLRMDKYLEAKARVLGKYRA
jgi:hypothetical protein